MPRGKPGEHAVSCRRLRHGAAAGALRPRDVAFSVLLTVPPVFAGLWVWSGESDCGYRLFHSFLRRARSLWSRVQQRPGRWAVMTLIGLAAGAAGYWLIGHYL